MICGTFVTKQTFTEAHHTAGFYSQNDQKSSKIKMHQPCQEEAVSCSFS